MASIYSDFRRLLEDKNAYICKNFLQKSGAFLKTGGQDELRRGLCPVFRKMIKILICHK